MAVKQNIIVLSQPEQHDNDGNCVTVAHHITLEKHIIRAKTGRLHHAKKVLNDIVIVIPKEG